MPEGFGLVPWRRLWNCQLWAARTGIRIPRGVRHTSRPGKQKWFAMTHNNPLRPKGPKRFKCPFQLSNDIFQKFSGSVESVDHLLGTGWRSRGKITKTWKWLLVVFLWKIVKCSVRLGDSKEPNRNTEVRETWARFCREPSLMLELYENYDCRATAVEIRLAICCCWVENQAYLRKPFMDTFGWYFWYILAGFSRRSVLWRWITDTVLRRCSVHKSFWDSCDLSRIRVTSWGMFVCFFFFGWVCFGIFPDSVLSAIRTDWTLNVLQSVLVQTSD